MTKTLIFIPYQDTDTFFNDSILTREYAILYLLYKYGYTNVINVCKPRTILDKKYVRINYKSFPDKSIERKTLEILLNAPKIQFLPILNINQIIKKREWWIKGYKKTIELLNKSQTKIDYKNTIVYSNNPYSLELLKELKKHGAKIYFDIMDNFAIHPSLRKNERKSALNCYIEILNFADIVSANSNQTCNFMKKYRNDIKLVKNGVFIENNAINIDDNKLDIIEKKGSNYDGIIGYIGKIGKRIDSDLVYKVSKKLPNYLFVFVGENLKDQVDKKLIEIFNNDNNVLHIDKIPSSYVYSFLDKFDILSIPHSVGKNENGGDPLKLYQYLTRKKYIITTPILGVDEFSKYIKITDNVDEWVEFIKNPRIEKNFENFDMISWESRFNCVKEEIEYE